MSKGDTIHARWVRWRNARLQDPRFQRLCGALPFGRGIAKRYRGRIFDLVAGFVYSQTLLALVKSGALEALQDSPKCLAQLALRMGAPASSVARLLRAGGALRLVELVGPDTYMLGSDGAALMAQPGLSEMIRHHAVLYDDLADPLALAQSADGAGLRRFWAYTDASSSGALAAADTANYSALMAATAPAVAADILDAVSLRGVREVMDVAGGEGVFLAAAGARWPHLRLHLIDLPPVALRASARLAPFGDRARAEGCDILNSTLATKADLFTLVRVLHDHDDAAADQLLRRLRDAAQAGTRLLIAEPMSGAPRFHPVSDAYFGLYFMAMGQGQTRTPARIAEMARAAGWRRMRQKNTRAPELLRAMIAEA